MADGAPGNPPPVPDDPVLKGLNFDQLAQLVNEVSPEVFYQRAEAFDRAAARLREAVEQVRRELNVVRDAWTGGGADEFDALAKEVTGRVTGAVQTMGSPGYGTVLRAAGDVLAAHQRRMRDLQGRKTEDDSKPPAPGAPPPEETARMHDDAARQVLLDLRTAYWDVGNQLPALSYKDTQIGGGDTGGTASGGGGGGQGSGGPGGHQRPMGTDPSLLGSGGGAPLPFVTKTIGSAPGGQGGQGGTAYPEHRRSYRPGGEDPVGRVQQPWQTAGPEQEPSSVNPLDPVVEPSGQPWLTGQGLGGPEPGQPDGERPGFVPSVLGRPDRKPAHEKKPGTSKFVPLGNDPIVVEQVVYGPGGEIERIDSLPELTKKTVDVDGPGDSGPQETNPVVQKKTGVQTTIDSPAPVPAAPVQQPEVATSTGDTGAGTDQAPPRHQKSVQFSGVDAGQASTTTQAATFGTGGGGAAAASEAFKPEDRGMFAPGSGDAGTFQGFDSSAVAKAAKPGHNPADPMTSQPGGGMPMSPMMGGMAGMGGQSGQQNSRMAAMSTEPRPDAWPQGSGASGTLGRGEQKQYETPEQAGDAAKEKFAELDRLLERGK
ncbi:WXG100 family type VII secretion target [Amycolatopsis minnesotensis]|uniref:WXG100 family type VII secretion target n=1 Tax=Amycolatopsis minnesotensis TaxID=337894 RepID=A0ABP5DK78_9PSEU